MKPLVKKVAIILIVFAIALMSSCSIPGIDDLGENGTVSKEYNITFVFGDGREDEKITVKTGETVTITIPERDGYEFVGWCTDEELTNFNDFDRSITGDMTLYAKWNIDYKDLLSSVSDGASKSCVKIVSSNGMISSSQGSGVIYKNDGKYCYVLTNSHVVSNDSGTVKNYITVYDVYDNEYKATVIKNSPEYDLAVLKIAGKDMSVLGSSNIKNRIPGEKERVITISAPKGKVNTVELGDVVWYAAVENSQALDFEVLWIDGNADNGSSGGAVYDKQLNVIGIIYATVSDRESGEHYILAIPAQKVVEFLADIQY